MPSLQITPKLSGGFVVLDPAVNRCYPFIYPTEEQARSVASYIEQFGQPLWSLHKDGWLELEDVVLHSQR